MTEYDLFVQCIPMIAEMIVETLRLTETQYMEWKSESFDLTHPESRSFVLKVLKVVDIYRSKYKKNEQIQNLGKEIVV